MKALFLSLAVLFTATAVCQEPTPADLPVAVITTEFGNPVPESVPLGEPLYLSAQKSIAGESVASYTWIIDPPERAERARIMEGGRVVTVGTGLKDVTIRVTLAVAKGDAVAIRRVTIKCGKGDPDCETKPSPTPTPAPAPAPSPDPIPVPPQPNNSRSAKLAEITAKTLLPQKDKIRPIWLAEAELIKAGQYTNANEMQKATIRKMTEAVGLNTFLDWVDWKDAVFALYASEKLSVPNSEQFWRDVADALK